MKNLTLKNIAKACCGVYVGPQETENNCISDITTDSRKAAKGSLFIPIKGAHADGHDFIGQTAQAGAMAVLSEKELENAPLPYIRVKSTLQAVKDIAEYYLEQLELPVVGITGSVGKTSTKEVIASVLEQRYRVLKTQGNFNNELGLPLTVFRLREEDEIVVLEMGISNFGEMHRLAKVAKPDTCVITNIGCCHLENLIDRDGILRAKTEIFDFLRVGGHVILNGDDDKLETVTEVRGIVPLTFGMKEKNTIWADELKSMGLRGISCRIHVGGENFSVLIPIPGKHMVYNALAGTAVGLTYGMTLPQIQAGIESLQPVSGRFHIIETERYTIIDDCYNANPVSMKASLDVLQEGLGRRVAILGDMGELGENECALHEEVGSYAAEKQIDLLIAVGSLCSHMAEGAKKANPNLKIEYCKDREELLERMENMLQMGDTILVKASHFMQFEKVVEKLQQSKF